MTSRVRAFAGISRAPFLLLPVTLVAVGTAASSWDGTVSWIRALLALVGLVAAHVGVNALNEASDMQTGIDLLTERTAFHGGSGTLPSGQLSVRTAYLWGAGATLVAAIVGVVFLVEWGPVVLPVFLLGLFSVVAYTHVLTRVGVGEVFAGLGLGFLSVVGASLVQDGHAGWTTIAAAIPAFFMTFNLLFLNEFPDAEADRKGGRRHLVILLGRRNAAQVYAAVVVLTPLSIVTAVVAGALPWPALVSVAPTLLCAPGVRWALRDPDAPVPLPALGGNVAWNLVTNLVLAATLAAAHLG